jgi:hypothetical protein
MMEDGLAIVLSAVKTKNSSTSGHLYITKHERQGNKQRKRRAAGLQRRPERRQGAYEADRQTVDEQRSSQAEMRTAAPRQVRRPSGDAGLAPRQGRLAGR